MSKTLSELSAKYQNLQYWVSWPFSPYSFSVLLKLDSLLLFCVGAENRIDVNRLMKSFSGCILFITNDKLLHTNYLVRKCAMCMIVYSQSWQISTTFFIFLLICQCR